MVALLDLVHAWQVKLFLNSRSLPQTITQIIMPETTVNSFIVRFVQEMPAQSGAGIEPWHGIIRHVQSSRETRFTRIEDALAFMHGYVDINEQKSQFDGTGAE